METRSLHVIVLPWLAMGHLLPFIELSKRMARHGHRVSFLSTLKNIRRLPSLPPELRPMIDFVELRVPSVEHLPPDVEATIDLPSDEIRPYLRKAFDAFEQQLSDFLRRASPGAPEWILFDYAAHWVPLVAAEFGVSCAFLSLFSASVLAFQGPPAALMGELGPWTKPEDLAKPPAWIPFPSNIVLKLSEARQAFNPGVRSDASGVSEAYRFGRSIKECQVVAVRSCSEFEPRWLHLLEDLYRKPVITTGFFPPSRKEHGHADDDRWANAFEWLQEQKQGSVIYAAFGSEVNLTSSQVREVALGLEQSGLPFIWALRAPAGSLDASSALPAGFEERTWGRGMVCDGWVPQVQFLAHRSVGGFLTHGGWNSAVEGLSAGLALVLLPMMFDQGLNARDLVERGVGVEVVRGEDDGSFTAEGLAKAVRLVMAEDEGWRYRNVAKKYSEELFGGEQTHDLRVGEFMDYLWRYREQRASRRVYAA